MESELANKSIMRSIQGLWLALVHTVHEMTPEKVGGLRSGLFGRPDMSDLLESLQLPNFNRLVLLAVAMFCIYKSWFGSW